MHFRVLDDVAEICAGGQHGYGACALSEDDEEEAQYQAGVVE